MGVCTLVHFQFSWWAYLAHCIVVNAACANAFPFFAIHIDVHWCAMWMCNEPLNAGRTYLTWCSELLSTLLLLLSIFFAKLLASHCLFVPRYCVGKCWFNLVMILWIGASCLNPCCFPLLPDIAALSVGKCVALWLVAICGWWAGWPQFFRGWWQLEIIETLLSQCYLKPPASALLAHCTSSKEIHLKYIGNTIEIWNKYILNSQKMLVLSQCYLNQAASELLAQCTLHKL